LIKDLYGIPVCEGVIVLVIGRFQRQLRARFGLLLLVFICMWRISMRSWNRHESHHIKSSSHILSCCYCFGTAFEMTVHYSGMPFVQVIGDQFNLDSLSSAHTIDQIKCSKASEFYLITCMETRMETIAKVILSHHGKFDNCKFPTENALPSILLAIATKPVVHVFRLTPRVPARSMTSHP